MLLNTKIETYKSVRTLPINTFRTDRICFEKPVRPGRWQEAVVTIIVCSQYLLKMLHVT